MLNSLDRGSILHEKYSAVFSMRSGYGMRARNKWNSEERELNPSLPTWHNNKVEDTRHHFANISPRLGQIQLNIGWMPFKMPSVEGVCGLGLPKYGFERVSNNHPQPNTKKEHFKPFRNVVHARFHIFWANQFSVDTWPTVFINLNFCREGKRHLLFKYGLTINTPWGH